METSRSRGRWAGRIGWAAAILPIGFFVLLSSWEPERDRRDEPASGPASTHVEWKDVMYPPVIRPRTVPAKDAGLRPDEPIIGIVAGGRARAYRLSAMESRRSHLVNDLFGDVPVSVAYCDKNRCARAYTGPAGSGTLPIRVAGLLDGEMVLNVAGIPYFQESGRRVEPERLESSHDPVAVSYARAARESAQPATAAILHAPLGPELTTWRAWVEKHPDSDVYIDPTGRPATNRESGGARKP